MVSDNFKEIARVNWRHIFELGNPEGRGGGGSSSFGNRGGRGVKKSYLPSGGVICQEIAWEKSGNFRNLWLWQPCVPFIYHLLSLLIIN